MRSEKISVSVPSELAVWARREAARRHMTLSALVCQALEIFKRETHARNAEVYARAVLLLLAEGYGQEAEKASEYVRRYVQKARRLMGEGNGEGEGAGGA